jgi:RND family efflux transporter MFP subunit
MRKILLNRRMIALAVVLIGGMGATAARLAWPGGDSGSKSRAVREDFTVQVNASGKVEAALAFEIGPPSASGYWSYDLQWMIPEGSRVKAGDVIARFDTTQLDDNLRNHRADLEKVLQEREKEEKNLEVSLKQLRLDIVKAEGDLKKLEVESAVPEDLVSTIEVETLRLERELARKRFEFLKEKIDFQQELVRSKLEILDVKKEFSQAKIEYYEKTKAKFNVQAPVDGLVLYVPKFNGDRWEVGEGVWMLAKILKVADTSTLRVEADVLEVDSASISTDQPARVSVDAIPGRLYESSVSEIGKIVRERSIQDRSKVFDAIISLDGMETADLRPGMGVTVTIETRRIPEAITVPLDAIHLSDEGPYVLVEDGSPVRRPVVLGARNKNRVVVESGIEEGESVLLNGGPGASA